MTKDHPKSQRERRGLIGWIEEAFQFVILWFVSRSFWMLVRGLPAMAVFIAIPVMALTGQTTANQESLKRTYQLAAIKAAQAEDYAAAELWNRKLLTFDSSDRNARFRLALAVEAGGDAQRGSELLKKLTPEDGTGYVPAHFYLAGKAVQGSEEVTPEDLRTAVWHLNKIIDQQPDDLDARDMIVRLQIYRGELEDAADHISSMVSRRPELHLMLAGIYRQLSMTDQSHVQANQARVHFDRERSRKPDDLLPLLQLVEVHAFTHNFGEAERLLVEHLEKELDVDETKVALLQLALIEIDFELNRDQPHWRRVVILLERSLGAFPAYEHVFSRIAVVVGRFQGQEADHLRETLEEALADGRAPTVCHLLLGTMLGESGNLPEAIQHLTTARQAYPENPIVLNNLAWYLMKTEPPQLEQALEHINVAVEKAPEIREIRETRGQILADLGRPEEALPDLEIALGMRQVPVGVHETLSKVYEQLGNTEMADRHRQRAAEVME